MHSGIAREHLIPQAGIFSLNRYIKTKFLNTNKYIPGKRVARKNIGNVSSSLTF